MARRRLSDLLREEANKPSEDETATEGAEQSADESEAEVLEAEVLEAAPDSDSTKASATAKSRSTKRTETTEPQATPQSEQGEALLQKLTDFTTTLGTQKMTIEQLQTELEQTRKDVRLLTDANAKLTQELKGLQTKKAAADSSASKPPEAHAPQELKLAPLPAASEPIEASGHPLNTFNRDVGWFD